MKKIIYTLGSSLLALQLLAVPAHAGFDTMKDKEERREEERQRTLQESADITAIRESQQQASVLLKGLIVELRKQTVLIDTQTTEQGNMMAEMQKQTRLLEELVEEMEKLNKKKKKEAEAKE